MDTALAQIGAAFDEAAAVNGFKLRIERLIRLGPQHATVRARFGQRAEILFGRSLDAAIVLAERWWRDERKAFQVASALGYGNRLSFEVLRELRVILRLLRFKKMQAEFGAIVVALCDEATALAAE
jgi:ATP phosphoribosyltransferase regulatory subunit HisZ